MKPGGGSPQSPRDPILHGFHWVSKGPTILANKFVGAGGKSKVQDLWLGGLEDLYAKCTEPEGGESGC